MGRRLARILAATLLSLFLFFAFTLFLSIFNTRASIADAGFYKGHLAKVDIYEKAYTDIIPAFIEPGEINKAIGFYGGLEETVGLTTAEVEELARRLFPRDFIQGHSERFIDEVVAYARKDKDSLDLVLDLRNRKQEAPGILLDFVSRKYDALPNCTGSVADELGELERLQAGTSLPSCFPSQAAAQVGLTRASVKAPFMSILEREMRTILARDVPDQVDLVEEAAEEDGKSKEEFLADFEDARGWMGFTLGWGFVLALVLMVLFMGLLLLLYRRNIPVGLRWGGGILVIAGILAINAAIQGKSEVTNSLEENVDFHEAVDPIVISLGKSMAEDFFGNLQLQGILALVVGAVLLAISILVPLLRRRTAQPSPPRD